MRNIEDELIKYSKIKYYTIKSLKNRIDLIENDLIGVGGITYSDLPTGQGHKTSLKIEKMILEKKALENRIKKYERFLHLIEDSIAQLEDEEREILTEIYIEYNKDTNMSVCSRLNMSIAKFYRLKKKAIKNLGQILLGEEVEL